MMIIIILIIFVILSMNIILPQSVFRVHLSYTLLINKFKWGGESDDDSRNWMKIWMMILTIENMNDDDLDDVDNMNNDADNMNDDPNDMVAVVTTICSQA